MISRNKNCIAYDVCIGNCEFCKKDNSQFQEHEIPWWKVRLDYSHPQSKPVAFGWERCICCGVEHVKGVECCAPIVGVDPATAGEDKTLKRESVKK